jgi:hypothetical protein
MMAAVFRSNLLRIVVYTVVYRRIEFLTSSVSRRPDTVGDPS